MSQTFNNLDDILHICTHFHARSPGNTGDDYDDDDDDDYDDDDDNTAAAAATAADGDY